MALTFLTFTACLFAGMHSPTGQEKMNGEVPSLYWILTAKMSAHYYHLHLDQLTFSLEWYGYLSTSIVTIRCTILSHMLITIQYHLLCNSKTFQQLSVTPVHRVSPPGVPQNRNNRHMLLKIWQALPTSLRHAVSVQSRFALLPSAVTAWAIWKALLCTSPIHAHNLKTRDAL